MGLEKFGHDARQDRKENGATYTPSTLALSVANKLISGGVKHLHGERIKILDPGAGDGALIDALLKVLDAQLLKYLEVTVVDISKVAIHNLKTRLETKYPQVRFNFVIRDFFELYHDLLKHKKAFDIIIANPPYVRTQSMQAGVRNDLRKTFGLEGRADLSFAFILAISTLLTDDGVAAIITSNKLMTTAAGASVRETLLNTVEIKEIWDLGDTRVFDAAVLPCVLFFTNFKSVAAAPTVFRSIYRIEGEVCEDLSAEACEAILCPGKWTLKDGTNVEVRLGGLSLAEGWRLADKEDEAWAARVIAATFSTFGDIAHVRVGIKTTADTVFISKAWEDPQPEMVRPLITHHIAGRFKARRSPDRSVLYPYEVKEGRRVAVDICKFPKAERYLEIHRERLEDRDYLMKSGREWFEIWVPHHPDDWFHPKVVFRDIAERPTFWMDHTSSIVNGDCYWITMREGSSADLLWLILAVANSSVIERYYDVVLGERLYAGRRRFMTRHVRKFPLPDPSLPASIRASEIARELSEWCACDARRLSLEAELDRLVCRAFGLQET